MKSTISAGRAFQTLTIISLKKLFLMLVSGQLLGMYAGARLAFVARSWINQQSL